MKVYKRGEGEPEFTVTGSLHGDEPAGKKAIERFLEEEHEFLKPVQFIVGNEKALEQDERYVDADLNRSFPGDEDSEEYEERLAAEILELVKGTKLLDLHTTRSYPLPFSTFSDLNDTTRDLLRSAGVKNAALFPEESGTLNDFVEGVLVETGFQGTDMAAMNALGVMKNFLAAQGVIDGSYRKSDPNVFRHTGTVDGDWEFLAENFKLVREGEVYARKKGEKLRAEQDFYPILMSTNGYEGMLGFKAEKLE
ncbi:MAG: succinylglutamate desuccinylase/aspartoacylase family protein [Candidatus Nanosalina sp.]